MKESELERIVVLGGGLEGWTAAAGIATSLHGANISITVVEIPGLLNVEPVQYTIPETLDFFRHIGIDETELSRRAGATFRLGTEIRNLRSDDDEFIRAFGTCGANIGFILFHHFVTRMHATGTPVDFNAFSANAIAASERKFTRGGEDSDNKMPPLAYGMHLNTDKLTKLLRRHASAKGVRIIEGQPVDIRQAPSTGLIEAIALDDGQVVEGDLFIDCSGEAALLIGEALSVPFVDWSHWLPCNRRVNLMSKERPDMRPLLRCTAIESGWIVQAPLRHRTANQLLYSSYCTSDEEASNQLIRFLGDATADAMAIGETRSGHRRLFWTKNCIAFGASAGHVEPLDLSDLHLVQSGVMRLMRLFPSRRIETSLAAEFNRESQSEFESLRDYTLVNYLASDWRDTRFWRRSRGAETIQSVNRRLDLFLGSGRLIPGEHDTYTRENWVAAFITAGFWPANYDPLLDSMDSARLEAHFEAMREAIRSAVSAMPTHADYINQLLH
jgi:tryptophan halogenase